MGYTVLLLAEFECAARREGCSDQLPKLGDRRRVPGRLIAHPCAADSQERNHTTSQLASIIYYGVVEAFFRLDGGAFPLHCRIRSPTSIFSL